MIKHWHRLHRQTVHYASLEIFKSHLIWSWALDSSWPCLRTGNWTRWTPEICSSHPQLSFDEPSYDTVVSITTDKLLNLHKYFPTSKTRASKTPHLLHIHTVTCSSLLHFEHVSFMHFSFLARWFLYHNSPLCHRRYRHLMFRNA